MSKKQISEKQLQANRKNAKKSTGPKTPEGKARSSQNAIKHGLLARQILINDDDPNEKAEDFDQLLSDLLDEFQPAGRIQGLLVERIAVCYWRLRRAYRYEAQSLKRQREEELGPFEQMAQTLAERKAEPFARILPYDHQITLLVRYESMIDRQLNKAMTQLQKLQSNPLPIKRSTPTVREGTNLVCRHPKTCGFLVEFADPSMIWTSNYQIMEDRHGYSEQEIHYPPEQG